MLNVFPASKRFRAFTVLDIVVLPKGIDKEHCSFNRVNSNTKVEPDIIFETANQF